MPKRIREESVSSPSLPSRLLERLPVPIPRKRFFQDFTFDRLLEYISSIKGNIVILCGAGISTSVGIKDFRSLDSGIYSQIAASNHPLLAQIGEPQEVFHYSTFLNEPEIFYAASPIVLSSLLQPLSIPSLTHHFITELDHKGKLLMCFTQNIDGLETQAGVSSSHLIECHGNLKTASCLKCLTNVSIEKILPSAMQGIVPYCEKVTKIRKIRQKKSKSSIEINPKSQASVSFCGGIMKPSCIFFNEPLPSTLLTSLQEVSKTAELLLVIGTSLNVAPVSYLPRMVKPNIPVVLINKERISSSKSIEFDLELIGNADDIIELLLSRLGWSSSLSSSASLSTTTSSSSSSSSSTTTTRSITITKSSSTNPVYIVSKSL